MSTPASNIRKENALGKRVDALTSEFAQIKSATTAPTVAALLFSEVQQDLLGIVFLLQKMILMSFRSGGLTLRHLLIIPVQVGLWQQFRRQNLMAWGRCLKWIHLLPPLYFHLRKH